MNSEWKILEKVLEILQQEKFLGTESDVPVVDFHHPHELKEKINFDLENGSKNSKDIEDIIQKVVHYSVRTGHPNFHNQLFAGLDPFALAGSWVTEALNTSQYTYEVAPAFILIEDAVIQKCLQLTGFDNGDGIFCPGGSMSNMYGMVMARYKDNPDVKRTGMCGQKPLVYFTSQDAHYSILKGAHWLGIGTDNVIAVPTDARGCMIPNELDSAIRKAINDGKKPVFVNATAGTTVLGAFDDYNEISKICQKYGIWMHVDACLGGTALLSRKYKKLLNGLEKANSLSWNPHKSLGAPLQCSIFLVKEKGMLHKCNSASANYLFQQDKFYDVSYDTGDKSVQCGRKVDAFKFWLMFKARGMVGFEDIINRSFQCAEYLTESLRSREGFELVIDEFQYTNVCFWYIPRRMRGSVRNVDWWQKVYMITASIKEEMVKKGSCLVGYTPLPHKGLGNFFRMVITCHPKPTKESMDFIMNEIENIGEKICL